MALKKLKKTMIVLLLTLTCSVGVAFQSPAPSAFAEGVKRTQSSFITSENGVKVTENYSHATLDKGKSGVLIESTATGTSANGASFSIADPMTGTFSLDYRVFSEKDYAGQTPSSGGADWGTEALNPYCDLRQLTITVTDTISGKSFSIIQEGAAKYSLTSTMFSVKTGSMKEAIGYKYPDWDYKNPSVNLWGYKCIAYGTSFSNKGLNSMGGYATDGGLSSNVEFDPSDMKVYVWAKTPKQGYTKVEIIDLSNPNLVGVDNVLSTEDFTKYTVSVTFDKLTNNAYTDANIMTAYDRTARMILYSLNGQSFAGTMENGSCVITDNVGGVGILTPSTTDMCAGKEFSFSITSYDVLDGFGDYTQDIFYSTDYDDAQKSLTYANGYKVTLEKFGTLTVTVPGKIDSNGNAGTAKTYVYRVRDEFKPEMVFVDTVNLQEKFDIEGINNSICKPWISKDDIRFTSDDRKQYTVSISVTTPQGTIHTNTINSLPFNDFGVYTVTYKAVDEFGNTASLSREFEVGDFKAPEILLRSEKITAYRGESVNLAPLSILDNYTLSPNYTCAIYKDGTLVENAVERFTPNEAGEYIVVYEASDESGNTVNKEIKLTVLENYAQSNGAQPTFLQAIVSWFKQLFSWLFGWMA
ncbi:MAG: hypothetical protein IJW58_04100 [Clostridia bacterium]|nr:hypothetical protein [Clostridia bacterium]